MVLEHVLIEVPETEAAAYERAFALARPLVMAQPGCLSCRLLPRLDHHGHYLLLIEWTSREAHTEGFRRSPAYREWSALLHPFYRVFPTVKYYALKNPTDE